MNIGDYVRIGNGHKVYQIVDTHLAPFSYQLAATADHPDAAERVSGGNEWCDGDRLKIVRRRGQ
jgi:hypothetical protein